MLTIEESYRILGVPEGASQEQIKCAYRRLAMKYHPDRHKEPDKKIAEEQFKLINEAYSILTGKGRYRRFTILEEAKKFYEEMMREIRKNFETIVRYFDKSLTIMEDCLSRTEYITWRFMQSLFKVIKYALKLKKRKAQLKEDDIFPEAVFYIKEYDEKNGTYHLWLDNLAYEEFINLDELISNYLERWGIIKKIIKEDDKEKYIYLGYPYVIFGGWHYVVIDYRKNITYLYIKLPNKKLQYIINILSHKYNIAETHLIPY